MGAPARLKSGKQKYLANDVYNSYFKQVSALSGAMCYAPLISHALPSKTAV